MADEEQYSLSDDEIKSDYRTNPEPLREAFRHLGELEERMGERDDGETIEVPVATLRRVSMGLRIMAKSSTEFMGAREGGGGNRGSGCDYNPFKKIDF